MSVLTRDQFIACLKKSQAIDEKNVDAWMSRVTDKDAPQLASKLVRDQLLTSWQAKYLLSGRWRLNLGSYRLLSRINRDELGDRFEAIHRQLGRKVVIQIFPSAIGEDAQMRQRVLKVIQQLTELDHRALVHVYDVDQEGGRYFVVTEFIQSKPLSDLPRGNLDGKMLARIIEDLLHGVLHAHTEGIAHGSIIQENILVTPTGEPKLQGIPTAAVRSEISANAGSFKPEQDFDALAQIGRTVLQEIPPEQRGEGEPELVELLEKLSACVADQGGTDEVLQGFADWRARFNAPPPSPAPAAVMTDGFNSGSNKDKAAASLAMTSQTHAAEEGDDLADQPEDGAQHRPNSNGFFSGLWNNKPRARLAIMVGALCVILAGAASAYYVTSVADRPDTQENSGRKKRGGKKKDLVSKPLKLENLPKGDGLLSSNRPRQQFDPAATKKKFADMHAQQKKQSKQSKRNQSKWKSRAASNAAAAAVADAKPNQDSVEPEGVAKTTTSLKPKGKAKKGSSDRASKIKEVVDRPNPDDETVASASTVESKEEAAATGIKKTSADVLTKTAEKSSSKLAAKKRTELKPPVGNPFKVLPETIDLPLFTDLDDFKIADLVLSPKYLMSLKLLTGPEVCKSKAQFDLVRSESDKQLWDVRLQRRKRETPVPIAQFQKTPSEFLFRWLPAASQYDEANYIRNCKIKASSPDYLGWVGLRKPLEIEDFVFPENKTAVKLDVDLKWLPNPENLKIELTPFSVEKRVKGKDRGNVYLEPQEITRNLPGIVFFRKDEKFRFLFLRVTADVRAKLKLQCQMYVLGGAGEILPLRKTSGMEELANALTLRKQEAMLRSQQAETADLPKGMTKTEFNKLKKELGKAVDLAVKQSDVAEDYMKIVAELANRRIPFEVFFELEQQRIKLAQSEPQKFESK